MGISYGRNNELWIEREYEAQPLKGWNQMKGNK